MKIEIRHVPVFELFLTKEICEALTKLSKMHYDANCKAAGVGDGCIAVWSRITANGFESVSCDARAMDTVIKILEMRQYLEPQEAGLLGAVALAMRSAMRTSGAWA